MMHNYKDYDNMTKKDSLIAKAMRYDYPEEIPILCGFLPIAWFTRRDELRKLKEKYSDILGDCVEMTRNNVPNRYLKGDYPDGWGCIWSNKIDGLEAYVTGHPIKTQEDMMNIKKPKVDMGFPHGFMYLRILDLLGFENSMMEFAMESDEIQHVIDVVLEYNMEQVAKECEKNNPIIYFGDDLGMQTGLAIGAEKWRKYFKPCFSKIYNYCHEHGKLVYMHTDGQIYEIIQDLKEAGADMVNPQFRANGLDNLERVCKGKVPICLDLDRQSFPFATPKQLKEHVIEAIKTMYMPEGGLGINIEFGEEVPLENMEAVLDTLNEYRFYKG